MQPTKIYIGADHAGFALKAKIKRYLLKKKYDVVDLGNTKYVKEDDYPLYGWNVAKAVAKTKHAYGILICGSSEGICIVANKIKGIRAVAASDKKTAELARAHNDANVICLSGWHTTRWKAKRIIKAFLNTPFSGEYRHQRRVTQIKQLESKQ